MASQHSVQHQQLSKNTEDHDNEQMDQMECEPAVQTDMINEEGEEQIKEDDQNESFKEAKLQNVIYDSDSTYESDTASVISLSDSTEYDSDTVPGSPLRIRPCKVCKYLKDSNELRTCNTCGISFCITCAPPLAVAVLQCCNFHGRVVWFCSAKCNEGNDEYAVRIAHCLREDCIY